MSEAMFDAYLEYLVETCYPDPSKVLAVKEFLDANFARGAVDGVDSDGYPSRVPVAGMRDSSGNPSRNLTGRQVFDIVQDKFKDIIADKETRDKFLGQVVKDWYKGAIADDGSLPEIMVN